MTTRPAKWALVGTGVAGLGVTAYLMVMTTFMVYDDEGFVLMSLRRFLGGEPLYDAVFSQYGPAPYLYHWLLTLGGTVELTHMFGRLLTVIHWVTCAVSVGWIAAHLVERHRWATGVWASLFTFNLLWQMIAEPSHPGSMIAAVLAVTAAIAVGAIRRQAHAQVAGVLGGAGAILILTKINVGAFFIAGVGAFALVFTRWPPAWRKPAAGLALAGLAVLPWLLMAGNLHDPAMRGFALKASLGGMAIWWVLPRPTGEASLPARTWALTTGWFLVGTTAIVGFTLSQGTSLGDLITAVFIDPLRQPGHFTVPPRNSMHSGIFAAVSFAVVGWAGWNLRQSGEIGITVRRVALGLRMALVVGFVGFALRWPGPWGGFTLLDYVLPLLPLWLVGARGDSTARAFPAIAGLAFLAVTQVLHAFPVAGSQIGWGCFLSAAIIASGVQRDLSTLARTRGKALGTIAAAAMLLAAAAGTGQLAQTGWERYRSSQPLPFAGAGDIRVDDRTRIALIAMVQNAMVHSDVLFTRQGMYSFNIWSQVPTPTARNATHWFWLLDEQEQRDIIQRLTTTERAAFIVNEPLDAFLATIDVAVEGPLQDFVEHHFTSAVKLRGFDFRVAAGQDIAPLGWALLFGSEADASATVDPYQLQVTVVVEGTPERLEVINFDANGNATPSELGFGDIDFVPVRRDGAQMGESLALESAGMLRGIYRFTALTDRAAAQWDFRGKGVVIKDASGTVLAEALFE